MDRKRRTRYVLAIYFIIACLAVIFLLIGINYVSSTWQSVVLNLSTELLGVFFVFLIVNLLFLADEWSLSERVEALLARLELAERPSAKDFFKKIPELDDYLRQADQIDFCGVVLTTTINKQLSNLRDRLMAGAAIRILLVDPESLALQMATLRSEEAEDIGYYRKKLEATFNDLDYLYRYWKKNQGSSVQKGSLSVRLLPYAPSFGILSFASQANLMRKTAFVEMFTHHHRGYGSSPTFTVTPQQDGDWHSYFISQFEAMWETAKPWDPQAQLEELTAQEAQLLSKVSAHDFFTRKMPDLEDRLSQADSVMIIGVTLVRTSMSLWQTFKACLERGVQLRFQLIDPEYKALLEVAANRSDKHQDPESLRLVVEQALGNFRTLIPQAKADNLLQVRLFPAVPAYGIWLIDAGTPKAEIWVELYAFQYNPEPSFHLIPGHDGEWFNFFQRQAEVMWSKSRPWLPNED